MATVSFKDNAAAAPEAPVTNDAQDASPAVVEEQLPSTAVNGVSTERNHIRFPRLQIIAKTGKLSDEFPKNIGEWLFDGQEVWGDEPLRVIVLGAPHWVEENLEFEDNAIPRRWRNVTEAARAGFRHADDGPSEHTVVDAASLFLFVRHPEGDYEAPDGTSWLIAELGVRKGAFKDTWVKWNTQRATGRLRDSIGGTLAGTWDLLITSKSYNGNSWYSPILAKPKGDEAKVGPEFRAFLKESFGAFFG